MDATISPHNLPQYAPNYLGRKNINMDEEIRLFTNNKDRDKYDNMADLFSIIVLMEHLEKAFIRDSITPNEYTPQCANLIAKYKTTMNFLADSVKDLETFMDDYKLTCPAAVNRFKIGVPATYEHAVEENTNNNRGGKATLYVAETVSHFITLLDTLRVNRLAVDDIHPLLEDLIKALNNVPGLSPDYEAKATVRKWLIVLNGMKAADEITTDQARQMVFEIDRSHNNFYRWLSGDHHEVED
ncbi:VPS28 protein-domain-containing protein [Halteromyces radiatus]|uniref:VPS28 protein-domain-containing protein n=1 Tax=Halteromyces radiatus TaxID=101107 RepID=UPI0022202312|nr:VPS28 protein-domain-containing protein [Halteromyces radiatus]KAI8090036.1 VPS28 protein-domain-containing protein [Halteromyces radiatus]